MHHAKTSKLDPLVYNLFLVFIIEIIKFWKRLECESFLNLSFAITLCFFSQSVEELESIGFKIIFEIRILESKLALEYVSSDVPKESERRQLIDPTNYLNSIRCWFIFIVKIYIWWPTKKRWACSKVHIFFYQPTIN